MFITRRSLLRTARLLPVIITVSCHNDDWNGDDGDGDVIITVSCHNDDWNGDEGCFYFILIGDDNDDLYKTHTMVELVLFRLISEQV